MGDARAIDIVIRPLAPTDSIEALTDLLHRAYKRLADMNLRYFATHQTPAQTRERLERAECFVATIDGKIVGTISAYMTPATDDDAPDLYRRDDVACFGQFAVDPDLQGTGLGGRLIAHIEARARELGKTELALDTAETAQHLIDYYARRGWRIVGDADWDVTNYRSVLMSKHLDG